MSDWSLWLVIGVIGAGTFAFRLSGIQLLGGSAMPTPIQRALRYVPSAVISAIVLPAVVYGGPDPGFSADNTRLLAGVIAALVAWSSRSVLLTLATGMATLWLLEWLVH